MLAFALILTSPLELLSVQSDSERRIVLEGSTGTAHYGGSNVPNVQTKCSTGCHRLHSACYDNNHTSAISSAKVILVHYEVQQFSVVSTMQELQILSSSSDIHQFLCMVCMLEIGYTSVWCVAINLNVIVMTG
jgi:hypothetical protein